jgi:DNA repair protein RadC
MAEENAVRIREAVVRYRESRRRVAGAMRSPDDVARFVRRVVGNDAREHFVAILLDGRHRPIAYQVGVSGPLQLHSCIRARYSSRPWGLEPAR